MDFSVPVTEDIGLIFPTPVLLRQIPDYGPVNDGLKAQILAAKEKDEGVHISNRGGWQSSPDLWDWGTPEIETFKGWVHGCILRMAALPAQEGDLSKVDVEYVAGSWANVNTRGAYNDGHVHPDCDWACVYYAECGTLDPGWDRNGQFELHDPRTMAQSCKLAAYGFDRSLLIDPEPGKMILFPAWMKHSVHPFYGDGQRISIAVNIKITGGEHSGR
ncbi:MAG: hypothetical protein HOM58_23940 [Rhodospirillaceae bacterium]|jgi:uncharacterized protein (TIGR02466 family)|nr:hypothetical protein [Rhodospirillaceae bacterium]MBT5456397.1 hypothetical protein [Rhodospirillaceae bacterium]